LRYRLEATLQDGEGNPLQGKVIEFYHYTDPSIKTLIGYAETNSDGVAQLEYSTQQAEYVIAHFSGDEQYAPSWSNEVYLNPTLDYFSGFFTMLNNFIMVMLIVTLIPTLLSLLKEKKKGG